MSTTHSPAQVTRAARTRCPAPYAWATSVCTAIATPPNSSTNTMTNQYTAPTAAMASVEMWPMNQVSVRFNTACMLLLRNSGAARAITAR